MQMIKQYAFGVGVILYQCLLPALAKHRRLKADSTIFLMVRVIERTYFIALKI